jgi:hypothetical protein
MTCAGAIGKFAKPEGEGRRIRVTDTAFFGSALSEVSMVSKMAVSGVNWRGI